MGMMLRLPWPWRLAGALSLLPALLWQAPRPAQGHFDLLAADVGQGSAVLVRTRTHSLLYDAGPQYSVRSNAGERIVLPLLGALNEQPGWLLLSHQDNDHAGGAASLLAAGSLLGGLLLIWMPLRRWLGTLDRVRAFDNAGNQVKVAGNAAITSSVINGIYGDEIRSRMARLQWVEPRQLAILISEEHLQLQAVFRLQLDHQLQQLLSQHV